MTFKIFNFPLPPSVNALYSTIGYENNRRVKSKVYVDYQRDVRNWVAANLTEIKHARDIAKAVYGTAQAFHVDSTFYMLHKQIVCKDGKPKRNDTSNRLKALYDVIGDIVIGLDDSYFWSGSFFKYSVAADKDVRVDMQFKLLQLGDMRDRSDR